ncbi:N-acetylmuramoyl-L-alanine amidase [Clostridium botulinum]|uniref:N-acetylmuramoyl-L-alanine amidase n=1 Tax=Clostridium botulinum TaxID=1491 RepID=UPI00069D604E|nr:N-acetylmuramoyl-L-alanine amidase [Clostridium botulinum]MCD3351776.1 N-acetylmuramoyl-L-alanine amidase [Clostridium botulinum D/C]MCD3360702.1 N-acetylmuramoyl-L-alanine amidase [Clostridium botulinum D/C]MCD3362128.1 N-acetylmuramoyl-L-alanine amidase [Clostridium botulinum D/C]MCD3366480.1 N-acetylmuramoyl-L-alanine amidase [Clostridium botulinum D/C]
MKIFIDPGHGGSDSGATGNGLLEKDIVLDISLKEAKLFKELGHDVKLSRSSDIYIPLSRRALGANNWGADLFISNHVNAGGGIGSEVWHSIYGGKGKEYASRVEENLAEIFKSRGIKSKKGQNGDYLYVIRNTKMPTILNEFGFIDNLGDSQKLKREDIRQKCAEAVVFGICHESKISNATLKRLLKLTQPMQYGDDVKLVQTYLNKQGYYCNIDGWYGSNTKKAIMNFQNRNGLSVDGIVGNNTWDALRRI